ncbi:thiamine pyrophosphokinase [Pedobacter sp. SD-b]|uniref:Thiamine pyrophosphokinase n=1 Tax=Pedobacter segetis TaxID=2793069 RepID=A0ABS1BEW6_9SPHI|nr:thiamine pyrophosphokinase [Pedobacter segetis]MBK0381408.1 thiamine pyrophosphokinase [Pedobacter segetis]
MSSHHIVREKQEPALIIINLAGFELENLGQLLEWSPMVLVAEDIAEEVLSLGIKIDVVLSAKAKTNRPAQEHTKFLAVENSALATAMDFLLNEGFPSVNIITKNFSTENFSAYLQGIDIVVFNNDKKIYPIKSGFNKWKAAGEKVVLMNHEPIEGFSFVGLKEVDDKVFKTEKNGFFSFSFDKESIFIAEEI